MTSVAIDGPAGAGKSTVARAVAETLGWDYLDTGAMYRAITLAALDNGVDANNADALALLTRSLLLELHPPSVYLNGQDVSVRIRDDRVTENVSTVAAHPQVRNELVRLQRELAQRGDVVMEGRDIGTNVLPDADLKVWLTADLDQRAVRRAREMGDPDLDRLRTTLEARDAADANRSAAPLKKAEDALVIDTTDLTIDEVVQRIVEAARALESS
jgi:CMP/dCMP kinase